LANNEVEFMILEGPMVFVALLVLTIWHPGYVFGTDLWNNAGFHLRKSREPKTMQSYKEVDGSSQNSQEGFVLEQRNREQTRSMV
jgi:hypothetical protein